MTATRADEMGLLGGILLALVAIVALLVLLPWHAELTLRTAPLRMRLALRALNGHAPAIPIRRDAESRPKPPRPPRPTKPRKRHRRRPRMAHLQGIGRLMAGLIAAVGLGRFTLTGRIGLPDPAETGTLHGLLQPLIQTGRTAGAEIDLIPDFAEPCFDLTGRGTLILRPLRLAAAVLRFCWANRRQVWS
jgi:hypothetical protein